MYYKVVSGGAFRSLTSSPGVPVAPDDFVKLALPGLHKVASFGGWLSPLEAALFSLTPSGPFVSGSAPYLLGCPSSTPLSPGSEDQVSYKDGIKRRRGIGPSETASVSPPPLHQTLFDTMKEIVTTQHSCFSVGPIKKLILENLSPGETFVGYHGTTRENAERVMRDGLQASPLYIGSSLDECWGYAGKDGLVLVIVKRAESPAPELTRDERFWTQFLEGPNGLGRVYAKFMVPVHPSVGPKVQASNVWAVSNFDN